MKEKRGNLLIMSLILVFLIVLTSSSVYAVCCYGELVQGGCRNDLFTQEECDANTLPSVGGVYDNTFDADRECENIDECNEICCCNDEFSTGDKRFELLCDKRIEQTIEGKTCSFVCGEYEQCEYTDCNNPNPESMLSPGCYCTSTLRLDLDNPYCCEATGQKYSLSQQCPAECKDDKRYIITGFVLDQDDNSGIQGAVVYLDIYADEEQQTTSDTDEDGMFTFTDLTERRTYTLRVVKTGYSQVEDNILVVINEDTPEAPEHDDPVNIMVEKTEEPTEICHNFNDDDNDNYIDQCDADCNQIKNIESMEDTVPDDVEEGATCSDGIDNDCDTYADCQDYDCRDYCEISECGNNRKDQGEQCDGTDDSLCPGKCIADGESACTCELECGNGLLQPENNEQCDAKYDASGNKIKGHDLACLGLCITPEDVAADDTDTLVACTCKPFNPVCGDGKRQGNEMCDFPPDMGVCKAGCIKPGEENFCQCVETFECGDGKKDITEGCDPGMDYLSGSNAHKNPVCLELREQDMENSGNEDSKYTGKCNPRNDNYECECELSCRPVVSSSQKVVELRGSVMKHNPPITLNWEFSTSRLDFCDPDYNNVLRCELPPEEIDLEDGYDERVEDGESYCGGTEGAQKWRSLVSDVKDTSHVDELVQPDRVYCYKLRSHYFNNVRLESNVVCIATGQEKCFDFTTEFCAEKQDTDGLIKSVLRAGCDNKNFIGLIEDCSLLNDDVEGTEFVCIGPYDDEIGSTKCKHQVPCYRCSDPLGMFYDPDNKIQVEKTIQANQVTQTPGYQTLDCDEVETCYFDYSDSIVDIYKECSKVKSCYDYRSEKACEGIDKLIGEDIEGDKCKVGGIQGCEWKESDHYEFGIGVCAPVDDNLVSCDRCNDPFNKFFGKCNANLCELYGDEQCFYSSFTGECINKDQVGCEDYGNNRNYCIDSSDDVNKPATNFTIDVIHDSDNNRISGSHEIVKLNNDPDDDSLKLSNDLLNLGRCKWLETEAKCIKDADNNNFEDCTDPDDFHICKKDVTPATTNLLVNDLLPAASVKQFSVVDDYSLSTPEEIEIWYSIFKKGEDPVYPYLLSPDHNIYFDVDESDDYTIMYYSVDKAKNLEKVKSKDVFLDADPPVITITHEYDSFEKTDDEWLSNLAIYFSANDPQGKGVRCITNLYFYEEGERVSILEAGGEEQVTGSLQGTYVADPYSTIYYTNLKDRSPYILSYTCEDESGNIVQDEYDISIDGDKSITNILPVPVTIRLDSTRKVLMSFDTEKSSECRYDYMNRNDFNKMRYPFIPSTNKKHHEAFTRVFSDDENLFNVDYSIKCLTEDDKIIGNDGDRIILTIDNTPPITTPDVGDEWYYLLENQELPVTITCQDPSINNDTYPEEFGCEQIEYCIGETCSDFEVCAVKPDTQSATPLSCTIPFSEFNYLRFKSRDTGGNRERVRTIPINIQKELPEVNISIIDVLVDEDDPDRIVDEIKRIDIGYLVQIKSNKALNDISSITYNFLGKDYVLPRPNLLNQERTLWQTVLELNQVDHGNKQGQAMFEIDYFDDHNFVSNVVIEGRLFMIDTMPPDAPILEPFEEQYHNHYSTLKKIGSTYYTNKPALYFSGKTNEDDELLKIYYYLGDFQNNHVDDRTVSYQEILNEKILETKIGLNDHEIGDSELSTEPISEDIENKYVDLFGIEEYGSYSYLYEISDQTDAMITISPELQKNIDAESDIDVYEDQILSNWFIKEIGLSSGNNYMKLRGKHGPVIESDYTPVYNIFRDSSAPEIGAIYYELNGKIYPFIASYMNNPEAKIVLKLKEFKTGSMIQDEDMLFEIGIGDNVFSNQNSPIYFDVRDYVDDNYENYRTVMFKTRMDSIMPMSKVKVFAQDRAENKINAEYDVFLHPNTPNPPEEFIVPGANCYDLICFVDELPETVKLDFNIPITEFSATHINNELTVNPLADRKQFIISTLNLEKQAPVEPVVIEDPSRQFLNIVKTMPNDFEITYRDDDNLKSKEVEFLFSNFEPLEYYKVLVDDAYLMKLRANIRGNLGFDYNILGKKAYNFKIKRFEEDVYNLKFLGSTLGHLQGQWVYTFVVDDQAPEVELIANDVVRSEGIVEAKPGEPVLIRVRVNNENFDLYGNITIDEFENQDVIYEEIIADLEQVSNDEFVYRYDVPEQVEYGFEIPFSVSVYDSAGNYVKKEWDIVIDTDPFVTIIDIDPGEDGLMDEKEVEGETVYYVNDQDDMISVHGIVEDETQFGYEDYELYLWHGVDTIEIGLDNDNSFTYDLELISIDDTEYRNALYFQIGDSDEFKIVNIYSDKRPPLLPSISFEDNDDTDEPIDVRTTRPIIKVEYDEEVELIDYKIKNYGDDFTFDVRTEDNKIFYFTVNEPMPDTDQTNPFIFQVKAEDSLGNEQSVYGEISFALNAGPTDIYFINPKHRVATSSKFTLEVGTTRYAKCKYTKTSPYDQQYQLNFNAQSLKELTTRNPKADGTSLQHYITDFSIVPGGVDNEVYFVCDDGLTYIVKHFSDLRVDSVAPRITSIAVSRDVVNDVGSIYPENEILVETNEPTICKFGEEDVKNNYDSMDYFKDESYEDSASYKSSHRELLILPMQEFKYKYYVICEDLSGQKTEMKNVEFEVKKEILSMEVLEPAQSNSQSYLSFKLKTNQRAVCVYRNNDDEDEELTLLSSFDGLTHQEFNTFEFEPGQYNYYFLCQAIAPIGIMSDEQTKEELVYSFAVDNTVPVLTRLNVTPGYFCPDKDNGKYSLSAKFEAHDPESEVFGFSYQIIDENNNPVTDEMYTDANEATMTNLELNKEINYVVAVKPINAASEVTTSQPVNYSSLMPVYDALSTVCANDNQAPQVTATGTAVVDGIEIKLDCTDTNGCVDYMWGSSSSQETCVPSNTYDFEDGIMIESESYVCWSVSDQIGNTNQGSQLVEVKDADGDGVIDQFDTECPSTPEGETARKQGLHIGCAESEIPSDVQDEDNDGVADEEDICEETPEGQEVETYGKYKGCSQEQIDNLDDDEDGVINKLDQCVDTPYGVDVDEFGCQLPHTPAPVDESIWAWLISLLAFVALAGGGYYAYKKYPEMFSSLLGGTKKKSSRRTSEGLFGTTSTVSRSEKRMPRSYVEKELALRRRRKLKQRESEMKKAKKRLFDAFSTKPFVKSKKKLGKLEKRSSHVFDKFEKFTKKGFSDKQERKDLVDEKIHKIRSSESGKHANKFSKHSSGVKKDAFRELEKETRGKSRGNVFDKLSKELSGKSKFSSKTKEYLAKGISKFGKRSSIKVNDVVDYLGSVPKATSPEVSELLIDYLSRKKKLGSHKIKELLLELENKKMINKKTASDILAKLNL